MREEEARHYALRLLAKREYFESEMKQRLVRKGVDEQVAEKVVRVLVEQNLLSDRRYAEAYLRSRVRRGEAPWLAAMRARKKGVKPEAVEEALLAYADYDARSAIQALLHKKDPGGQRHAQEKVRMRLIRYLQGKGFDLPTILDAMQLREEGE